MAQPKKSDAPSAPARPSTVPWPPILYVIFLGGAFVLQRLWPWPSVVRPPLDQALGWSLLISGAAIGAAALLRFRIVGTSFEPTAPATALATRGIYAWSRNPMYLGAVVAFFGLGLLLGWMWLLVLNLVLPLALTKLAIEREEVYLEGRFGADYRAYKAAVRRWV